MSKKHHNFYSTEEYHMLYLLSIVLARPIWTENRHFSNKICRMWSNISWYKNSKIKSLLLLTSAGSLVYEAQL